MSTRAQALGAAGTVIDGRFRDVAEHRALGFPVFARATGTAPPAERLKVAAVDVEITVQSSLAEQPGGGEGGGGIGEPMRVRPGDYVVGDVNGVVVLPRELAEQALPLMRRQVDADEKMAEAIKGGMSFVEASKKFRF
jgi:regulator of RNase E activity RraA